LGSSGTLTESAKDAETAVLAGTVGATRGAQAAVATRIRQIALARGLV
jgi:hypothetical protein